MKEEQADTLTTWGAFKILVKAVAVLVLLIGFLMLFSCSTVKKSTTSSQSKTDSTGSTSTDTKWIIKSDSTGTKSEQGEYERETIYEFAPDIDSVWIGDTEATASLNEDANKGVVRLISGRLNKVTVKEKGSYNKAESANKSNVDSGGIKQVKSATIQTEITQESSSKEKSGFPWLMIAIVAVLAGGFVWSWKKYFK